MKNKTTAGILAILLGALGIHKKRSSRSVLLLTRYLTSLNLTEAEFIHSKESLLAPTSKLSFFLEHRFPIIPLYAKITHTFSLAVPCSVITGTDFL